MLHPLNDFESINKPFQKKQPIAVPNIRYLAKFHTSTDLGKIPNAAVLEDIIIKLVLSGLPTTV